MSDADKVGAMYAHLSIHATERGVCPRCGNDDAFVVTRTDATTLSYICFHASCSCRGDTSSHTTTGVNDTARQRPPKKFTGEVESLPERDRRWLAQRFNLPLESLNKLGSYNGRVMLPCYSPAGQLAGYVARYYKPLARGVPQGHTGKARFEPVLPGYSGLVLPAVACCGALLKDSRIILVEDWMSAHKLHIKSGLCAAPLLGTNITTSILESILEVRIQHITVMLDNDAVSKAVRIKQRYQHAFESFNLYALRGKDIKDMDCDEYLSFIQESGL